MSRAEKIAEQLLSLTREIKNTYEENKKNIKMKEEERSDLSHEVEFGNLNAVQRTYIFNELRKVLKERRKMKNENEQLEYLYNLLVLNWNGESSFQKALNNIKNTIKTLESRKYYPRIRKDLTIGNITQTEKLQKMFNGSRLK